MSQNKVRMTKENRVGIWLLRKGSVFKQDLYLFVSKMCSQHQHLSRLVEKMTSEGILYVKDFQLREKRKRSSGGSYKTYLSKGTKVEIVALTEKGIDIMYANYKKIMESHALPREQFLELRDSIMVDTDNISATAYEHIRRQLNTNHIQTLFNCIDINTDKQSKPSLEQIYCLRNKRPYNPYEFPQYARYVYYTKPENLESALDKGFFYTMDEYREFYGRHEDGVERFASVARGIFISNNITLVIYANPKGNHNMIYCKEHLNESKLIEALKDELLASDNEHSIRGIAHTSYMHVSALAITDVESFIYSTASGMKNGKRKKKYKNNLEVNLLTPKSILFPQKESMDDEVFDNYYVITANASGLEQLRQLLSTNKMARQEFIAATAQRDDFITFTDFVNPLYPLKFTYERRTYWCSYQPNYELVQLCSIRDDNRMPAIITRRNMVDIIQRVIKKTPIFIDMETMEVINTKQTAQFDEAGHIAGKKILEDYLLEKGLKAKRGEYANLHKRLSFTYRNDEGKLVMKKYHSANELFNAIANDEVSVEEVVNNIQTEEYKPHSYRQQRKKQIFIPGEYHDLMKTIAKIDNVTIYYETIQIIKEGIKHLKIQERIEQAYNVSNQT